MCLRPFRLYCSACLGNLFVSILCTCCSHFSWYCFISFTIFCLGILSVSILCTCCSHFSWYCFISFTIFSAPVFSLIHWFFLYLVLLFQVGVSNIGGRIDMGFYIHFINSIEIFPIFLRRIRTFAENIKCSWKHTDEQRRLEYFFIAAVG